jgi:hypothetical protein
MPDGVTDGCETPETPQAFSLIRNHPTEPPSWRIGRTTRTILWQRSKTLCCRSERIDELTVYHTVYVGTMQE